MSYLVHHGIKGQKWGVRRYQNKDGTLTAAGRNRLNNGDYIIKKGETIGSVSVRPIDLKDDRPTYAYTNDYDSKVYKGRYSIDMINERPDFDGHIYDNSLKVKKDLKVASEESMIKEFDSFYERNKKAIDEQMGPGFEQLMNSPYSSLTDTRGASFENVKSDSRKMFYLFNTYLDAYMYNKNADPEIAKQMKLAEGYVRQLKDKKYSALTDLNNKDVYYGAKNPVLVLDGKKYLENSKITEMTVDDIMRNYYELYSLNRTASNRQGEYAKKII